jgi:hypothetical protein
MPYINQNGKIVEVTQQQFDDYTIANNIHPELTIASQQLTAPAGGNVTVTPTVTSTILTPNTTDNTPGQILANSYPQVATSSADVSASATAGLTADQLTALGGADPTDPYIRARLGLPALSDVQTLSGAIANVNFANVGNTVGNLVTSFGNTVGNISLGDIGNAASNVASSFGNAVSNISVGDVGNTFSNVATSFGNAISDVGNTFTNIGNTVSDVATSFGNSVSNIGDYFSGNTATTVADSQVANTESTTVSTSTADAGSGVAPVTIATDNLPANADSTIVSTATADAGSGTTVGTTTDAVPASAVDTAPAAVDYNAGLAGTDTTAVSASQVDAAPADVSSTVDPQASLAPGETIVSASDVNTNVAAVDPNAGISSADLGTTATNATPVDPNAGISSADLGTTATNATDTVSASDVNTSAAPVDPNAGISSADLGTTATNATDTANTGTGTSADSANASANIQGLVQGAQQQQTIADQRKQINNGDWRVRLRLAPQANYLYRSPTPGILKPLAVTDGIIFPYTPQIDTNYRANYDVYDLTHSNYRGYFYKNSYVDAINLKATFTAQDTADANYLLAVITFLKSVTKMFYGQDAQRGAPPPVVYLTGLGDYQFREHSCLVSQFTYVLPDNVDYIRAGSPNNVGLNLTSIRDRQSVATNSIFGSLNRLATAFLTKGAITGPAAPPTLGLNRPTYVPTKMDINLTLLPIQSRQQVSKQFSVKEFANGNLIKGGFW